MSTGKYFWHFIAVAVLWIASCSAQQTLSVIPLSLTGEEGNNFKFVCKGTGTLNWNRMLANGTEVKLVQSDEYSVIGNITEDRVTLTLVVLNASPDKTGVYICKASDNARFQVSLTVHPVKNVEISPAEPEFVEGGDLYLNCTVNGLSNQEVRWSINNGEDVKELMGGDESSHVQVFSDGSLVVRVLTPQDAGIYICNHTFTQGWKADEVNVGGEITLTAEKSVKFTEGDRALLKCEAKVTTKALLPTFQWLVDGADWQVACLNRCKVESTETSLTVTSQLEINKITMDDRLNYTCIATNAATEMSHNILLRVRDRLAALWPFLGIVSEVVILIVIIFIHEKCSKGEDIGEEDEDEDDLKKEKMQNTDRDNDTIPSKQ